MRRSRQITPVQVGLLSQSQQLGFNSVEEVPLEACRNYDHKIDKYLFFPLILTFSEQQYRTCNPEASSRVCVTRQQAMCGKMSSELKRKIEIDKENICYWKRQKTTGRQKCKSVLILISYTDLFKHIYLTSIVKQGLATYINHF
jgi:hypothetical protein